MAEIPDRGGERDQQLSALYQTTAADEPPAALNDAIRAAARREVSARPHRAGAPFARWQMPLSIAAVLVLCVSLVAVMRDEGSELTQAPRAEAPPLERGSAVPKIELVPDVQRSQNIGLKPPAAKMDRPAGGAETYALNKETASSVGIRGPSRAAQDAGVETESRTAAAPAQRPAPAAFSEKPEQGAGAIAGAATIAGKLQIQREAAPSAEPSVAGAAADTRGRVAANALPQVAESAPLLHQEQAASDRVERDQARAPARTDALAAAKPGAAAPAARAVASPPPTLEKSTKDLPDVVAQMARLTPEKWLERIDELRKQGKVDEARAGLAEFRRRYPGYSLPPALRDWAQP